MVVSLDFLNVGCGRQGDAGDFKEFGGTETLRIPGVSIQKNCMFRSTFQEKKWVFHEKKYL